MLISSILLQIYLLGIFNFIGYVFGGIFNFIADIFGGIFNFIGYVFGGIFNFIADIFLGIFNFVTSIFTGDKSQTYVFNGSEMEKNLKNILYQEDQWMNLVVP